MSSEFRAVGVRLLAYMGALAILAITAASLFRTPPVAAAVEAGARAKWLSIERPYPAFELPMPELGPAVPDYAILRGIEDGGRKDVLTWGSAEGDAPFVIVEIYRPGAAGERFIDAPSEIAARIVDYRISDDVKSAGSLDSKFGPMALVDFAILQNNHPHRCLGFARPNEAPLLQIAGWFCSPSTEVVDRTLLACALDRLSLRSAGSDPKLAQFFARVELRRKFCGQRGSILAATPRHTDLAATAPIRSKLRGHVRAR